MAFAVLPKLVMTKDFLYYPEGNIIEYIELSGNNVYSGFKQLWIDTHDLIKYDFPMEAIHPEMFFNGWKFKDCHLLKDCSLTQTHKIWKDSDIIKKPVLHIQYRDDKPYVEHCGNGVFYWPCAPSWRNW
jgi:hypothetical protein